MPWTFVVLLTALYLVLLLPRVQGGQWLTVSAGLLAGLVLSVMVLAAITFSRDILTGRWP